MDIIKSTARSNNMSKIRGKDTSPELYIRRLLYLHGMRYRVNYKKVTGTPDLYFIGKRTAVFIHGCYWHRHNNCLYSYTPKSNKIFWEKKFSDNTKRDYKVKSTLKIENIRCLIVWECTIRKMRKNKSHEQKIFQRIIEFINNSDEIYMEV